MKRIIILSICCFMLILLLFGCTPSSDQTLIIDSSTSEQVNDLAQTPVANGSDETQPPEKPIIEGTNGLTSDGVTKQGEVYITTTLEEEIKNYGDDDVLFHVRIKFYGGNEYIFKYEGKTVDEYRHDPVLELYREEHNNWRTEINIPLDREMVAAEQRGEEYAQGWEKHSESDLFKEYWYDTQPEDVIAAYELAIERYDKADKAYISWKDSDESFYVAQSFYEKERNRLIAKGYDLKVTAESQVRRLELDDFLTRQQIEAFPLDPQYAYIIMWAAREI